jgi:hypothetical protein
VKGEVYKKVNEGNPTTPHIGTPSRSSAQRYLYRRVGYLRRCHRSQYYLDQTFASIRYFIQNGKPSYPTISTSRPGFVRPAFLLPRLHNIADRDISSFHNPRHGIIVGTDEARAIDPTSILAHIEWLGTSADVYTRPSRWIRHLVSIILGRP